MALETWKQCELAGETPSERFRLPRATMRQLTEAHAFDLTWGRIAAVAQRYVDDLALAEAKRR